ncbi:hypothetical protein L3Q82_010972 [Scortum barcoo]|uniref:Uncharacterized protein n=1 Tax=Scortum barcoo TaxID=214431 RepID=A0ACB8W926_9TELE|nr:hypothetical protein L3Q82_010972 [Scortum barcoo]
MRERRLGDKKEHNSNTTSSILLELQSHVTAEEEESQRRDGREKTGGIYDAFISSILFLLTEDKKEDREMGDSSAQLRGTEDIKKEGKREAGADKEEQIP